MPSVTYTVEDQQRMTKAVNYFAWQSRLISPEVGQRVIEAGCGIGNFTTRLLDRELVVAVDEEPACIEQLRLRYPNQGNLHSAVCGLEQSCFGDLARFAPDSCVCINVLEHLADDFSAVRAMASILIPGGKIILFVPAFRALRGPIDENLGHFRRYSRRDLRQLAAAADLAVIKINYVNTLGFFGWWFNARVLRRHAQSVSQIAIFDRLVPFLSRLELVFPPPFGQSLLGILEKRTKRDE